MKNIRKEQFQQFAIIISCYNEDIAFSYHHYLTFARMNPNVLLCFVNDGSTDNTAAMLKNIQLQSSENIIVLHLKQRKGKANAVREGMLYVHDRYPIQRFGYLDFDLKTTPEEWLQMACSQQNQSNFGVILGKRVLRSGQSALRRVKLSLMGKITRQLIQFILEPKLRDTYCGTKIFHRAIVPLVFDKLFRSSMLFDLEIILRLKQAIGSDTLQNRVLEFSGKHWSGIDDCRLKLQETIVVSVRLVQLFYTYRMAPSLSLKPTSTIKTI
ncbi:dolichyl-phosphate beta-glucosyltransferase [Echinicola strongylocentroti]|uniref:Dolichyl-phosphate beta-glucosyltransferase n=1 Tax=Echinicola strongylocentroti TaxID=1795355 RepID=A0A2Z4IF41_9BACT|nr:glycosyltransferase [Echinicola strongylocentroti]AWW29711.1 dolichyl-phosphate beta-glucosyltransferase [Echinicola strongylocentroti]